MRVLKLINGDEMDKLSPLKLAGSMPLPIPVERGGQAADISDIELKAAAMAVAPAVSLLRLTMELPTSSLLSLLIPSWRLPGIPLAQCMCQP